MIKLLLLFYFIKVSLTCDHLWNDFFVGHLFPWLIFLTLLFSEKIAILHCYVKLRININSNTNILVINLLKTV